MPAHAPGFPQAPGMELRLVEQWNLPRPDAIRRILGARAKHGGVILRIDRVVPALRAFDKRRRRGGRIGNHHGRQPAAIRHKVRRAPAVRMNPRVELFLEGAQKPAFIHARRMRTVQKGKPLVAGVKRQLVVIRGAQGRIEKQAGRAGWPSAVPVAKITDLHADHIAARA